MAPTDDAFNRLGNDTVAKLLQNPTLLASKLPVFTKTHSLPFVCAAVCLVPCLVVIRVILMQLFCKLHFDWLIYLCLGQLNGHYRIGMFLL